MDVAWRPPWPDPGWTMSNCSSCAHQEARRLCVLQRLCQGSHLPSWAVSSLFWSSSWTRGTNTCPRERPRKYRRPLTFLPMFCIISWWAKSGLKVWLFILLTATFLRIMENYKHTVVYFAPFKKLLLKWFVVKGGFFSNLMWILHTQAILEKYYSELCFIGWTFCLINFSFWAKERRIVKKNIMLRKFHCAGHSSKRPISMIFFQEMHRIIDDLWCQPCWFMAWRIPLCL